MQRTTWTAALLLDAVILPTHPATVVARSAEILSDLHLDGANAPGQVVCSSVAMVTSEILTQPRAIAYGPVGVNFGLGRTLNPAQT